MGFLVWRLGSQRGQGVGQLGFSDLDQRYRSLDAKNDPLVVLNEVVPWESFRAQVSAVWRKPDEERKSAAGRKPWDEIVMVKTLVLQALYNLSDDQVEYQIRDRLSFMRFLGLGLEDRVPDATTVWLYREKLAQAGLVAVLFDAFDAHLKRQGYLAMGGQIIDASIVAAPKQRAQQPGREPSDQGRRSARRLEAEQEGAEGRGRAPDEEARDVLLRLQEPCEHRPQAQARAALRGDGRGRARQPEARRSPRPRQHRLRRLGRQRLSLAGDGSQAGGPGPEEPHPP